MKSRTALIAALAMVGFACGPLVLRALPMRELPVGWSTCLIVFVGMAIGLPMFLASVAASGRYKTMVRLWSAFGALGILLFASGAATVALSLLSSNVEPSSLLALVAGAGILSGLGVVKLAIRRSGGRNGT